jgi:RHS repeat-associated protein
MKANASSLSPILASVCLLLIPLSAHCFYNPSTGRWLSRDPIAEKGAVASFRIDTKRTRIGIGNPYQFVRNNPVSTCDVLGLSEQDVTRILNQFTTSMQDMCNKKRRCDCFGIGPLKDIRAAFGRPYGCGAQADWMEGDIVLLTPQLNDKWHGEHRRYLEVWPVFYHQDVVVKPLDPNSGDIDNIVLDTFRGCYTITRYTLVQMPDPRQSFLIYRYETKCYTCADFQK